MYTVGHELQTMQPTPDNCPTCGKPPATTLPYFFGKLDCPHCNSPLLFRRNIGGGSRSYIHPKCAKCGSSEIAWIAWQGLVDHQLSLARSDEARLVAAGQFKPKSYVPSACLICQPEWLEIHKLAVEEEDYQHRLEEFVAAANFDEAGQWRDKRRAIHEQIRRRLSRFDIETE